MMPATRIATNCRTRMLLRGHIEATIRSTCTMEPPARPDPAPVMVRNAVWEGRLGWFPQC